MRLLSVECSAGPASAAVLEDRRVLASSYCNIKMTHSQTLLPMIEQSLALAGVTMAEIDGIAVAAGPGSFTGVRIGVSAVKGLAAPRGIPCAAVSTLRAMAERFRGIDGIVCAVMDARCNQVYNALFSVERGVVTRLCDDRALLCSELADELSALPDRRPIYITGDGTSLFYPYAADDERAREALEPLRYQDAAGVGLAAFDIFEAGKATPPEELLPIYLRLPQAERELKKRNEEKRL